MIVGVALMLSAQAAPALPPDDAAAEAEIVVIAQRLETWRGKFAIKMGVVTCNTTRSSGDRAIDDIGCRALTTCIKPIATRLDAAAGAKAPKALRRAQMDALVQAQIPCFEQTRRDGIAALADERAGQ